jgi:hypothetical protein
MRLLLNKISGNQPRHFVIGRNRRFGNHLLPHHQGSDVTWYLEHLLYIPARDIDRRHSRHPVTSEPWWWGRRWFPKRRFLPITKWRGRFPEKILMSSVAAKISNHTTFITISYLPITVCCLKNAKFKMHRPIILPFIMYGCETWKKQDSEWGEYLDPITSNNSMEKTA